MLDRHVLDRAVHTLVVVGRRHDQVAIGDLIVLIDLIVVDQIAARRLDHPDTFGPALARGLQIGALKVGIVQEFADLFDTMQHLDHPRPVGPPARRSRPAG